MSQDENQINICSLHHSSGQNLVGINEAIDGTVPHVSTKYLESTACTVCVW